MPKAQWTRLPYGLAHYGERSSGRTAPDLLVVFLHGVYSGPSAWRSWARPLLERFQCDFDILAYRYPAWFWQRADIREAARQLLDKLEHDYDGYKYISLIGHSMGGLVIKEMLRCDRINRVKRRKSGGQTVETVDELLSRIRSITYLAVPHQGGKAWLTYLQYGLYQFYWWFSKHLPRLTNKTGYFRPAEQLLYQNPWVRALSQRAHMILRAQRSRGDPTPVVIDAGSMYDQAVDHEWRDVKSYAYSKQYLGYASHFLSTIRPVVIGRLPDHVLLHARDWHHIGSDCVLAHDVAFESVRLIDRFNSSDKLQKIEGLIQDPQRISVDYLDQVSAGYCLRQLIEERHGSCTAVTGSAGTGKTILLRHFVREMAVEYLTDAVPSAASRERPPFPLMMSLRHADLDQVAIEHFAKGEKSPERLWNIICDWWIQWAMDHRRTTRTGNKSQLANDDRPEFTKNWIETCIKEHHVVLIFDAVDEFLQKYLMVEWSDFARMVRHLLIPGRAKRLNVVVGLRQGPWRLPDLVDSEQHVLRIGSLSRQRAGEIYGEERLTAILESLPDPKLADDLVLTNLVLGKLLAFDDISSDRRLQTTAGVLEIVVEAHLLLDPTGEPPPGLGRWQAASIQQRLAAVSIVGWAFALNDYKSQSKLAILKRVELTIDDLEAFLTRTSIDSDVEDVLIGFRLATDPEVLEVMLRRTIFEEASNKVGFVHDRLMEACIARYIALVTPLMYFRPMAVRGYYAEIVQRVGEFLVDTPITAEIVNAAIDILEQDEKHRAMFVIGNLITMISNSLAPLEAVALKVFSKRFLELPLLARHVLISGFSFRAMKANGVDQSAGQIRGVLCEDILDRCLIEPEKKGTNPATASLAWCLLKRFSHMEGGGLELPTSWPKPDVGDFAEIFDMACPLVRSGNYNKTQIHTLQRGLLSMAELVIDDPDRLAAAAHHLLLAVIACRGNFISLDAQNRLRDMLEEDGVLYHAMAKGFARAEDWGVPESQEVYELARMIYSRHAWTDEEIERSMTEQPC